MQLFKAIRETMSKFKPTARLYVLYNSYKFIINAKLLNLSKAILISVFLINIGTYRNNISDSFPVFRNKMQIT